MLVTLANHIPVDLFAFLGSFIEEVISPIPSPLVLTTTGAILFTQGYHVSHFVITAILAAIGKTIGSILIYFLAERLEYLVIIKFGKFLGVSKADVQKLEKYFGNTKKDEFVLTVFRAIPFMPTAPVSFVCGLLKLDLTSYIRATFIGSFFRSLFFLWFGYTGLSNLEAFSTGITSAENVMKLIIFVVVGIGAGYLLRKRQTGTLSDLIDKFLKKS